MMGAKLPAHKLLEEKPFLCSDLILLRITALYFCLKTKSESNTNIQCIILREEKAEKLMCFCLKRMKTKKRNAKTMSRVNSGLGVGANLIFSFKPLLFFQSSSGRIYYLYNKNPVKDNSWLQFFMKKAE
jgi:ubiquinone biosynthesis protein COQ9